MNYDREKNTLHFDDREVGMLTCEPIEPDSNIINLYFSACNFADVKQGSIIALRTSGDQSRRGMIPAVSRVLAAAHTLQGQLRVVVQELHPELIV